MAAGATSQEHGPGVVIEGLRVVRGGRAVLDGVTVTDIAKSAAGTATPKKTGDRITSITWQIDVQPNKYVALAFTATNPAAAGDLHWTLHEKLADGTAVDWSDKPGSKEKGSVTKITPAQ